MITKNIKAVKKISYYAYALALFSTVLTLAAPAAESFSKDFVDHPVKGGTVRVPHQPENPFGFPEKREDEIQKDLKSSPMDHHRQPPVGKKRNLIDYFMVENPSLLDNASKALSEKISFSWYSTDNIY